MPIYSLLRVFLQGEDSTSLVEGEGKNQASTTGGSEIEEDGKHTTKGRKNIWGEGLEPPASRMTFGRSIQLSYPHPAPFPTGGSINRSETASKTQCSEHTTDEKTYFYLVKRCCLGTDDVHGEL